MLQRFLPALSWAVVLAVATASLYDRWLKRFGGPRRQIWAALTFTAIVGAIVVVPLIYFGFVAVREFGALVRAFAEASPRWATGVAAVDPAAAHCRGLDPEPVAAAGQSDGLSRGHLPRFARIRRWCNGPGR